MPRLAALILLAGIAASALPRRRPAPAAPIDAERPAYRVMTLDELLLHVAHSPSKAVH